MPANPPWWCTVHTIWHLLLLPHLMESRGPKVRHLHQACGWICSYCKRPLDGCSSRGSSPIYGRSSKTEAVLQLEDWHHRFETWQSCPGQGRCLSREEEDHGQMGEQASGGSVSDHDRCPLVWSERPAWEFTCSTSQPAPHCVRSWHSLACGCLSSMGWMYQSHPSQAYSQREWQQDYTTRRWWSGNHPTSG